MHIHSMYAHMSRCSLLRVVGVALRQDWASIIFTLHLIKRPQRRYHPVYATMSAPHRRQVNAKELLKASAISASRHRTSTCPTPLLVGGLGLRPCLSKCKPGIRGARVAHACERDPVLPLQRSIAIDEQLPVVVRRRRMQQLPVRVAVAAAALCRATLRCPSVPPQHHCKTHKGKTLRSVDRTAIRAPAPL